MPRFYRYGFQRPVYPALRRFSWATRGAQLRSLGDVTNLSQFFDVPRREQPYWLHKRHYQRPAQFYVPKADSPYWLHKHRGVPGLPAVGDAQLSRNEKRLLIGGAIAAALYFLVIKKGAPFHPKKGRRRRRRNPARRRRVSPRQKAKLRAKRLLALAEGTPNEHERRLALQRATDIMHQHGFSKSEVRRARG